MNNQKISILGAGLVGSLLSILLQKRGYEVTIFERRDDMRKASLSAGRSINLAMSQRGWAALELAGLKNDIEEIAIPMYGRQIHNQDGTSPYQQYGKNNEAIYSVSRGELNKKLMSLAENLGVQINFNQKIVDVDIKENILKIENIDSHEIENYKDHDIIIAADGAFSSLRTAYQKQDRYNYNQFYIEHGYKELTIPAANEGAFLLEKEVLHIWPRKNYMLIALPNIDASFTCTLFFPFEGNPSFDSLQTKEDVTAFFNEQFPDAIRIMPSLVEDFFTNPTSSLVTVKCFPWIHDNKNMLIGDAAHAIVPFYGQGMNAGFEDCSVFIDILDSNKNADWKTIFSLYQDARKVNGDAVADLALHNFIEMRDLVADPEFLIRKKIEKELGKLYPEQFNSVYEMVSFSHTSYHVALKAQKLQDALLHKIMSEGDFDYNLSNENFKNDLTSWIAEYYSSIKNIN
jgi:kynurenine 3-monooxygenase